MAEAGTDVERHGLGLSLVGRLPLAGMAFGLGDLLGGHLLRNGISHLDVGVVVVPARGGGPCDREAEPHVGGHPVLRDANPIGVSQSEGELRRGEPSVGREPVPPHGLAIVLRDGLALGIYDPESVMCKCRSERIRPRFYRRILIRPDQFKTLHSESVAHSRTRAVVAFPMGHALLRTPKIQGKARVAA